MLTGKNKVLRLINKEDPLYHILYYIHTARAALKSFKIMRILTANLPKAYNPFWTHRIPPVRFFRSRYLAISYSVVFRTQICRKCLRRRLVVILTIHHLFVSDFTSTFLSTKQNKKCFKIFSAELSDILHDLSCFE